MVGEVRSTSAKSLGAALLQRVKAEVNAETATIADVAFHKAMCSSESPTASNGRKEGEEGGGGGRKDGRIRR